MKISGTVTKDGKFWLVEMPSIDATTQGKTRQDALYMAKDLVRMMLDDPRIAVKGHFQSKRQFEVQLSAAAPAT